MTTNSTHIVLICTPANLERNNPYRPRSADNGTLEPGYDIWRWPTGEYYDWSPDRATFDRDYFDSARYRIIHRNA